VALVSPVRRVALFGGSFDPVHKAHVALAQAALAAPALALDAVFWVPAGQPWQKPGSITAAEHRAAMVRLAIQGEARFVFEGTELRRTGPSYTLDTVQELSAAHPGTEWVLLIGQDQYARLHTWRGWQTLLRTVTLAVANRPGAHADVAPEVLAAPQRTVPLPMLDVSSTEIRRRVAAGLDITTLVPPEVAGYIAHHGLYRNPHRN
jgi:nicotinate-nucleotide adenylyltransferase